MTPLERWILSIIFYFLFLRNGLWILLFLAIYGFPLFFYYGILFFDIGAICVIGSFWYDVMCFLGIKNGITYLEGGSVRL
ncbi:hypothetical protein HOY82DRAFT_568830 [Tuber indicum]|nr:hypothetical protein HOY82DRAFT_568830 [Tuber indicum]